MDKRYTDIEEFYDVFWTEYISQNAVSDGYMAIHNDLIWEITFQAYEIWRKSEASIGVVARIVESTILAFFNYNPPENITFTSDLGDNFYV